MGSTSSASKSGILSLLHIDVTSPGRKNTFLFPQLNTFYSEMICAPTLSLMPLIAHASTKARGKVTSVRLPDGRILLVTKCNHLLACGDQSTLVRPSTLGQQTMSHRVGSIRASLILNVGSVRHLEHIVYVGSIYGVIHSPDVDGRVTVVLADGRENNIEFLYPCGARHGGNLGKWSPAKIHMTDIEVRALLV